MQRPWGNVPRDKRKERPRCVQVGGAGSEPTKGVLAPADPINYVRSDTCPRLVHSPVKGIGIPQGRLPRETRFSCWSPGRMCPPAALGRVGCSEGLSKTKMGYSEERNGQKEQNQLPLHCSVNLSLETEFLDLCLDFYWPEQAVSKAFSTVKEYSSPCLLCSLDFFARGFEFSEWVDGWFLSLLPLLSQALSPFPQGSSISRCK